MQGLLGPGDRKSVQPMAARVAPDDHEQLHHFIATSAWDPLPLETACRTDRLTGGNCARSAYRSSRPSKSSEFMTGGVGMVTIAVSLTVILELPSNEWRHGSQ